MYKSLNLICTSVYTYSSCLQAFLHILKYLKLLLVAANMEYKVNSSNEKILRKMDS